MKRSSLWVTMALSVVASTCFAQDQAQTEAPLGFALRGGVVFPLDNLGRNEGKNWFGGGFDYRLPSFGRSMGNGHLQLSGDFYQKGDLSAVPVILSYCVHNNDLFFSAGAGVAFTRDFEVVSNARIKRNRTQFAYSFGVGYEFRQGNTPLFAEAKFFGNGVSALNAIGVYLGIRL